MIERLKITTMYYKARFRYVAEKITNKLKLIKLISKCKNNHYILVIHTFAKSLTSDEPASAPKEKERAEFKTDKELISYLFSK